jgi:hypothetical protein
MEQDWPVSLPLEIVEVLLVPNAKPQPLCHHSPDCPQFIDTVIAAARSCELDEQPGTSQRARKMPKSKGKGALNSGTEVALCCRQTR